MVNNTNISEWDINLWMYDALNNEEFVPYFQPQINILDNSISGAEALARWIHPEIGIIMPGIFVPVFEENGFIYEMDKAIWRAVCKQIREWKDASIDVPPISVNISREDINHSEFIDELKSCVRDYNLEPSDLRLEITESAYLNEPEDLKPYMEQLSKMGFMIEMDDFGSGYSSLTALKDLPFDLIKLDANLLKTSEESGRAGTIISAIIRLTKQLNVPVIAEGVEDAKQAEYLKSLGCYDIQGFLYSKPLSADEFVQYMQDKKLSTHNRSNQYLEVIDETEDIVLVSDAESGQIIFANKSATTFFRLTKEELCRKTYGECWGRDKDECVGALNEADRNFAGDFDYRGYKLHAHCVYTKWNGIDAIVAFVSDYTNMLAMTNKMTEVLDNIPSGITIMEEIDGQVINTYLSKSCAKILEYGTDVDDSAGFMEAKSRINEDDWKTLMGYAMTRFADFPEEGIEIRLTRREGGIKWVRVECIINTSSITGRVNYYFVFSDISRAVKDIEERKADQRRHDDIMKLAKLGSWVFIFEPDKPKKMFFDEVTLKIMGLPEGMSKEECYKKWHERVNPLWMNGIYAAIGAIKKGEEPENLYMWNHPTEGEIYIRFSGYLDDSYDGEGYRLCGYQQIVSESVRREMQLTEKLKEANYDKRRDFLTGLYNRLDLDEVFKDATVGRYNPIKSIYMMDIDNFKRLNDTYGHMRGDECLRKLGAVLMEYGESRDIRFYRYGGEEVLALCFDNNLDSAQVADELNQVVRDMNFMRSDSEFGIVTVSVGYSTEGMNYYDMVDRADKAMYAAKNAGKNRACCYEELD